MPKAKAKKDETISAEVIMRPRGGIQPAQITAATVADATPDRATTQKAARWFAERGFEVGPSGPMSFSITAPKSRFRTVFKMRGKSLKRPAEMPDEVDEVTFPPPPDFGPSSY